ncbi:hypothetical protein Acsp03_50060 [Actinomadura sp. NBRC 104412]|nr:hypothetical protein Acsp03_50060 [Actinomadura sp. NBRC 104412]
MTFGYTNMSWTYMADAGDRSVMKNPPTLPLGGLEAPADGFGAIVLRPGMYGELACGART